ncbi:MAG: hypothetical protein ABIQ01_05770 [Pseudolysinimonas sp.]
MTVAEKVTAKQMLDRLQRHYVPPGEAAPGGVFIPEVTHGKQGGRRADAVYVGFYNSRGRLAVGHEIKVARSDWVHELEQAGKADPWVMDTHAWYVVAPTVEIVRPEELPEGWGLMVIDPRTKTRLRIVVKAQVFPDRTPSWDAVHSIIQKVDYARANTVASERAMAARVLHEVGASLRIPQAYNLKGETGLTALRARAVELGQNESAADLREQLAAEHEIVQELCAILGITRIRRNEYHRPGSVEVETIRTSFARWLAADASIESVLGHRRQALTKIADDLARILDGLAEAETALAADLGSEVA